MQLLLGMVEKLTVLLSSQNEGFGKVYFCEIDQEKIIMERVNLSESGSFYTKFGDIFALFCFLITSIFTLYSCKERFL